MRVDNLGIIAQLLAVPNIIVVFLVNAATDQKENEIRSLVFPQIKSFFKNNEMPQHRILFYETLIGKIAICRQLVPVIHIDFSQDGTCTQLQPLVQATTLIIQRADDGNSAQQVASSLSFLLCA